MGISYSGCICVGYTHDELLEIVDNQLGKDFDELCYDTDLEQFSPYYDADPGDSIYGRDIILTDNYQYEEILPHHLEGIIDPIIKELEVALGVKPKVYLMAMGS